MVNKVKSRPSCQAKHNPAHHNHAPGELRLRGDVPSASRRSHPASAVCLGMVGVCVVLSGLSCGGAGDSQGTSESGAETSSSQGSFAAEGSRTVRWDDERVVALREALADGWADVAQELMDELAQDPRLGLEASLLQARLAALRGDPIGASRHVEAARAQDDRDGRVWATAAELAVQEGSFETALAQLEEGKQRCGETPELLRAEANFWLFRPGLHHGKRGLDLLLRARALDPDLPFSRWPLSEAHRLYAQSLSGTRIQEAIVEAEQAVALSAENQEARELLGDLYMADHRWGAGIEVFEGLLRDGRPLESKVALFSKQAGVVALQQGHKDLALEYFTRARELGLSEEELGTGAGVLQRAAQQAVLRAEALGESDPDGVESELLLAERCWPDSGPLRRMRCELGTDGGLRAMQAGDWEQACEAFQSALAWDEHALVARLMLGRAHLELGEYPEASAAWHRVIDQAREMKVALPDPVHLDLARALALQDRFEEARSVLQGYLDFEPEGPFVDETRRLLQDLPQR